MLNDVLDQLESAIRAMGDENAALNAQITELKSENSQLKDQNETLQLEFLDLEEKNKETVQRLSDILTRINQINTKS